MDKTDKQAVYDIATKLGYEGAYGPSVASGIYAVALALGYTGATDGDASQALQALYTVAGSGGGGGGDLGALQPSPMECYTEPTVGGSPDEPVGTFWQLKDGDTVVLKGDADTYNFVAAPLIAANMTIVASAADSEYSNISVYKVTLDGSGKFATVAAWDGTVTKSASEFTGNHDYTFTMPVLGDGEFLALYYVPV